MRTVTRGRCGIAAIFVVLCASLLAACEAKKPVVTIGATPLSVGGNESELVGTIPQGGHCDGSKLAISSWAHQFTASTALDGSAKDVTPGPGQIEKLYPSTPRSTVTQQGDPQIVSLPDGRVVLTLASFVGRMTLGDYGPAASQLTGSSSRPDTYVVTKKNGQPLTPDDERLARQNDTQHSVQQFRVSKDCGASWTDKLPSIDDSTALGGNCSDQNWKPLPPADKTQPTSKAELIVTGYDRAEMYADPWTGTLFFNTTCDRVDLANGVQITPAVEDQSHGRVWRLRPTDTTWQLLGTVTRDSPGRVMTTTSDGALWLFHCAGAPAEPSVTVMQHAATAPNPSFLPEQTIKDPMTDYPGFDAVNAARKNGYKLNPCAANAFDFPTMPVQVGNRIAHPFAWPFVKHPFAGVSISRAGRSAVRVSYSRLTNDNSVDVVTLYLAAGGPNGATYAGADYTLNLTVKYTSVFKASKPGRYTFFPTFIQRTDPQRAGADSVNVAVLYWFEADPLKRGLTIRYSVVRSDQYTPAAELQTWTQPDGAGTPGIGDYMYGAYACLGSETTFFPIWPEQFPPSSDDADKKPHEDIATARLDTGDSCTPPAPPSSPAPSSSSPIYTGKITTKANKPPVATVHVTVTVPPAATAVVSTSGTPPSVPIRVFPPPISSASNPSPEPTVTKVVDQTVQPPVDDQLYQCANDTVYGTHLAGATKVSIGGQDLPVRNVTDTMLMFTVPCLFAPTGVPLDFVVTTPNGTSHPITVVVNGYKP